MPEPASVSLRARGTRLAAAIIVPLVVVLGSAAMAAIDLAPGPEPGRLAAPFLPPDGFAALAVGDDGTTVTESSLSTGVAVLLQIPGAAADPVFADLGDTLSTARLWRTTSTSLEPGGQQLMTVYSVTDAGVRVLVEAGGALGFSYSPAMTVLPGDVAPGVTWSESGAALPGGLLDYRVEGRIESADDGCLRVLRELEYAPAGASPLLSATSVDTWCAGRGIVASEVDLVADGESRRVATRTLPFDDEEAAGLLEAAARRGSLDPPTTDWSRAVDWSATTLAFRTLDPMFGETVLPGTTDAVGVATTSGTVALSYGADVVAYRAQDGVATRAWIAHPGGRIVSLGVAGDVVLAATSERTVAAYSDDGVRLWEYGLPDLAVAAPVADGFAGVIVVTLDGTVARLDVSTGAELWSARIREAVDASPTIADGVVVVADRAGGVHAFALDDGAGLWTADVKAGALVAAGSGAVIVLTGNADILAFDLAGTELWRRLTHGVPRAVAITDGVAIGMTDEVVSGWDLTGGDRLWGDSRSAGLLAADGRVVLLGESDLLAVDARAGTVVAEWPTLPLGRGEVAGLVAFRDRLWLVTTLLAGQEFGP